MVRHHFTEFLYVRNWEQANWLSQCEVNTNTSLILSSTEKVFELNKRIKKDLLEGINYG